MNLAFPLALLLLPLPFLIHRLLTRPGAVHAALQVPSGLFAAAMPAASRGDRFGRILLILAWGALVVALSGPRLSQTTDILPFSGREIILAIDLSGSMVKEDFVLDGEPLSRLEAVKRVASGFVAARKGDRIGLVVFGERPYVAQPPTFDVASVARSIETAQIGISGRATAIADGLGLAVKRLEASQATTRIVVLLSDGVDTSGKVRASDVSRLAAQKGIRVHTIALGPEDLESQPGSRDAVDAAALKAMAEIGGGTSFRVRTMDDLQAMAATLDRLEPSPMRRPPLHYWRPLWIWPAGAAFLLLLLLAARRQA
ncbi:VWA domain-containing protein [Roseibium marinum]|uniref:Ca-activated chloride channel family protein n=1 Tax=Roseibium marinum TaxID=281252 RepID=A0A2S3V488_9HYPH|nr:VWA domain-containing protein [Roseibium marinum]POF34802.1 Ca-activated chloride channel family protein [Roseibium marinum]